jgi:hypothetical protein
MTIVTLLLINSISTLVGTFAANFALLWLIGNRVKAAEEKRQEIAQKLYTEAIQKYKEDVEKIIEQRKEYMKMES